MKTCGQCGEQAIYGGFASIPGKEIFESWRCLNCMLWDVRESFKADGKEIKNILIVKSEDLKKAD